jgi:hypothetical protein
VQNPSDPSRYPEKGIKQNHQGMGRGESIENLKCVAFGFTKF